MYLIRSKFRSGGFTLIELLVVIAIIGILASVVLASLDDTRDSAKESRAQSEMRNIHTAVEMLYNATGLYPHNKTHYCPPVNGANNEVDLNASVALDPYFKTAVDPWGTPYFLDEDYQCTAGAKGCNGIADASTDSSVLVSCGPNRLRGNGGGAGNPCAPSPENGNACCYDDDNVVYVFCRN